MPVHPRISLHPASTPQFSIDEDMAACREIGLARMSTSMSKLARDGNVGAAIERVASSGLAVDFVVPDPPSFNLRDRGTWVPTRERFAAAADAARRLNAPAVFTTGGYGLGLPFEPALEAFGEAIEPVVAEFRARGVRLLFEPVRPQFAHVGFVHTFRDAVPVARRFGFELVYDFAHCWWEPGLMDLLARESELIGAIQLCDLDFSGPVINRANLGDGQVPIRDILRRIAPISYRGAFDLELTGPRIAEEGLRAALTRAARALSGILRELSVSSSAAPR